MTKKKASEVKKGDKLNIGGQEIVVSEVETSDAGKQGAKKVRIVGKKGDGEPVVLIRPENYPVDVK